MPFAFLNSLACRVDNGVQAGSNYFCFLFLFFSCDGATDQSFPVSCVSETGSGNISWTGSWLIVGLRPHKAQKLYKEI